VLGAFHLGRSTAPPAEVGERCQTKAYPKEPLRMQDCRRVEAADGGRLDVDDHSVLGKMKPGDADVKLEAGILKPAAEGVTIARLSSAEMDDSTYQISYPGCKRPETTTRHIDLRDLDTVREAICVRSSDDRVAILWLVDFSDVDGSAVFNLVCWKKEG
jgi:hypothetical protein